MDFARITVFALGLLFGSLGVTRTAGAATVVPVRVAHVAVPSGQRTNTLLFSNTAATSSSVPSNLTWGAPYSYARWTAQTGPCENHHSIYFDRGPPEATEADAVADFESAINGCFGRGCSFTVEPLDPNDPSPYIVGYVALGAGCTGGDDIYATAHSKNVGAGGVNDDGEGNKVNDAAPYVGDPINASTGNKYLKQDDYVDTSWLTLRRFYNSDIATPRSFMGLQWRHSFDRLLTILGAPVSTIIMTRPDGSQETFTKASGQWTNPLSSVDQLTETDNTQGVATLYTVSIGSNRHIETYDTSGLLLTVTDETGQGITLAYSTSSTPTTVAPRVGLLLTVTDPNNRQLSFTYNSSGLVSKVTLPDKGTLTYGYNGNDYLTSVQYPDSTIRQYLYNETGFVQPGSYSSPFLTGIIDENGVRYSSTGYDAENRASVTLFGGSDYSSKGGAYKTAVAYNSDGTSSTTYPLGHSTTMGFSQTNGLNQIGSVDQSCGPQCGQHWKTRTYDTNGYPASYTDFNNNLTTTQYDAYGELNVEVDASGTTNQRTTNTTWDTTLRVPLTRTVLDRNGNAVTKTAWVYNTMGQPLALCEIDPAQASGYVCAVTGTPPAGVRRWTYTYCTTVGTTCPLVGLLLTVTGPRTDLTQTTAYAYYTTSSATSCGTPGAACYQAGDLYTITDAKGHVTTLVSYDADGRVTRSTDPNGVNTDSTYTPRGWLATRIVGGATTTMTYWPYGAIKTITDPDGVLTTYTYDAAHRLTKITDDLGNSIQYTLDGAGNKTSEQTYSTNPQTLVRSLSRTFNTLGQLTAVVDGLSNTVFNAGSAGSYDANGNLVLSSDALGIQRQQGFDALNRLKNTIANYNGTDQTTTNTQTQFTQDALGRLTTVTDPSGLNTTTTYDGLNDRTALQSPDTGSSSDTYDAAGNRLTHTDAKGVVSTATYDALNRRISTSYADTTLNVTYSYDDVNTVTGCTSSAPIGRLTRVVEGNVTTVYCYSARGKVSQKKQMASGLTDVTSYTYTTADRLNTITAPDNAVISYAYNGNGFPSSVTVTPSGATSAPPTVVSAITWLPFGPISSYTLGNGQKVTRTYDANYRFTDVVSPALSLHIKRDAMGDITALGNAPGASPATETYLYDPLYRLTSVKEASGATLESYTYDKTGDRLSKTATDLVVGAGVYSYTSGTHQLSSIGNASRANDANGSTTGSVIGGNTYGFGYNGRNRMTVAQLNGATVGTYTYNALGQRIGKVATFPQASTERYAYDENNDLVGEYGTTNRDYIWLAGIPVAVIDNTINGSVTTSVVNYVHADGLGTPRAVTNSAGTVIWQWAYQGNPFGEQQPTSTTGYVLNLRYPGQYYDAESKTNYNMLRTYEPATGRYLQSDPIGLAGGMSTFAYVDGEPLDYKDSTGRCPWCVGAVIGAVAGGIAGYETGGWEGALIGGVVGGAAGAIAPWASLQVGALVADATGSILAGQVATVATLSAANSAGSVAGTMATNEAEGQPLYQGVGEAAAIGAVAPLMEGVTLANGVDGVAGDLISVLSGVNTDFLTASTLPIVPTIRPDQCQ